MNAEDLVEFGASAVHPRQVSVVDDDSERELAEIIALELDLLDALPKFPDLGFFRVVG